MNRNPQPSAGRPLSRWGACFLLLAALGGSLAGCNRGSSTADAAARVNGRVIERAEVEKYYKNQTSGAPQQPAGEQSTSLRLSILRDLVDQEIMMQRAEKLGLLATDAEVDAKVTEFKAPYTQEEFEKRLKERNLTHDDLRRDLRRNLTIQKVINKEISSKITISDADVNSYWEEHKAEFNLIEPRYHLAQILVTTQPNPQVRNLKNSKAQNEAEARKKVQEILNRLESGEDFATLAMNYSEDPQTASNGGDLGFAPESALRSGEDPAIRDAVLRLKPGETTNVITIVNPRTRQAAGFRIVRLLAKEPAGQRELSDPRVQQVIREQLRERREQLLKAAYYEVVRNEAKVDNYLAQEILDSSGK
ncbi:MAG: SurA N-terminal domain-containing protein [Acidobacteria bacterium]|nr:SurA N-terminal domain-containing protein [Acidobacteriota bacterium]